MNYLLITVILSSSGVFFMGCHGLTGAIIWGLNILLLDFFWQWLRWRQVGKANGTKGMTKVTLGYFIRLFSVLAWLKIGQAWFAPQSFLVCEAITLAIPVTSILGAYMLVQRRFK
jgi:hypothetical protein